MKKYNNYTYISPIGVISEVKKRLNKYFATNQLDESMIGIHIENCVRKLGVGALEKTYAILKVENGKSSLPDDFYKLNIAYRCFPSDGMGAPGWVNDFSTNFIVNGFYNRNITCTDCNVNCDNTTETWEALKVEMPGYNLKFGFAHPKLMYLSIKNDQCIDGCKNLTNKNGDEFTMTKSQIFTSFPTGFVFFSYFAMLIDQDETGYPMIIDEIWFIEYVRAYLYYQFYEDLYNDITDETANQIAQKRATYKQEYEEKLIIAQSQAIAPTKMQIVDSIKKDRKRFRVYNID